MNAPLSIKVDPSSVIALATYLASSGSAQSPGQAAACAIDEWLASRPPVNARADLAGPRGYRWKCLFLPEMTQIRMLYNGLTYHAQVVGDDIIFEGKCVSPRQMTLMITGGGRNAWRDLLLRYPGESTWAYGMVRRSALARKSVPPLASTAAETMAAAAAAAKSQALKAALELVEHADAGAEQIYERRTAPRRRGSDRMMDDGLSD